ncbi:MAG: 50S ribosomal protein L21 [Chloroflexi bacterium]|nr:50S ribosomal protein L21 [Chloroflexota bacterium]
MYAVIETGSKQYRVEVGTELEVELLEVEPGQTITLDRVLLVADGETTAIGRPVVDGATVSAEVVRFDRGDKVIAFKYRPKARRRVKKGHRQELTILRVADIVFGGKSAAEAVRKAQAAAKTERQRLEEAAARQAAEDTALASRLAADAAKASAATAKAATTTKAGSTAKGATTKAATKASTAKPGSTAKGATTKASAAKPAHTPATARTSTPKSGKPATGAPAKGPRTPTAGDAPAADAPKRPRTKKDT